MTVFVRSGAVDGGWEAIVGMEEYELLAFFEGCVYRVEI